MLGLGLVVLGFGVVTMPAVTRKAIPAATGLMLGPKQLLVVPYQTI